MPRVAPVGGQHNPAQRCQRDGALQRLIRANHWVEVVGGVLEQDSAALVRAFFADHRQGG